MADEFYYGPEDHQQYLNSVPGVIVGMEKLGSSLNMKEINDKKL